MSKDLPPALSRRTMKQQGAHTRRVSVATAAVLLTLPAFAAYPQEHAHSEGAPPEKLGTVHFATSCSPAVAPQFDRAVALLHSFEFGASIRSFNEVLAADSTCAMAYWGIALSRWTNPMAPGNRSVAQLQPGQQAVDAAMRLAVHASERERGYIHAVSRLYDDFEHKDQRTRIVAYERAMNELVMRQPADTEAMIFYAISLVASAPPTDKTYANQLKAGSILEPLWAKQPNHPGLAHYIIHTYDYPALADKARAAAQRYAAIAPSAAHALHMPSHTFTRVGMWEESVKANNRSMKVALSTGSIAEALHAADYAMYADLQMGKESDAKAILDGLPALAARFDPNAITGAAPGSAGVFALAAIPARWALERSAWRGSRRARAESERLSVHGGDDILRPRARRVAHWRSPKGKGGRRFAGVDSAAVERDGRRILVGAGGHSASRRAGLARSRRAPGERCSDAHARSRRA